MKPVIVFGGAGFIGSHVCDHLSDAGYDVTVFDIKESPYLRDDQKMIVGDILDTDSLLTAIKGHEIVFNFAGIADIDECMERPMDTVRYNVLGNVTIMDAMVQLGIKRYVFASSAYVYSNSGGFYRSSKQASELFVEDYRQKYGLEYTILRYGSLYGPRSDMRNSIFKLVKSAIIDKEINYKGGGDERREFIHVRDAAKLTVDILSDEFINEYVVLTGNQSLQYNTLLTMIAEMLGGDVNVNYLNKAGSAHYRVTPYNFSPKVGKKLINNPHVDLGQGILEMMEIIYNKLNNDQNS